jgi:hypothetical protein
MTKLVKKLTEFFKINQASALEQFIISKRPTNAAEVDFWLNQYNRRQAAKEL